MNTISMFYGIIIRMYCERKEYAPMHFHAFYENCKAVIDINTCELIGGELPKQQLRLVLAWTELHQNELKANWQMVIDGEDPFEIEGLK